MTAKTIEQVDAIMARIYEPFRYRWCGGEYGPCACLGCVQICSRSLMYEKTFAREHKGDAEYIDERRIPPVIREACRITREEWEAWKLRHPEPDWSQWVGPSGERRTTSFEVHTVTLGKPTEAFDANASLNAGGSFTSFVAFQGPNDIPVEGVPEWVVAAARRVQATMYDGDWSVETIARLIHAEMEGKR